MHPRLAGQAGLEKRCVLQSIGSCQELAVGHSKTLMGAGHMEQCVPRELRRKDSAGPGGIHVSNTNLYHGWLGWFLLVLIYYGYTGT